MKNNEKNSIVDNTIINDIVKPINKESLGLAIGIICDGRVPMKWMMHMLPLGKTLPGGLYYSYVYALGDFSKDPTKNYATLRKEVVDKAKAKGAKWLLFIDSDVFLPDDAVNRLMSHDKDIVTGVYWMKTQPPQPVIYKEMGDGPMWDIKPQDELIEIGGAGLGCTLIKMSVFDKFDEAEVPYFKQDWIHKQNGKNIQVSVGEDHWFFMKARELGFKVWFDSNVLCDHYDYKNDIFYPGEEVVRKITSKKLKNEGHKNITNHQLLVRNVEKDKPTIVFYNDNAVPFNGESIKNKPIAGSETAVIQMAKNFKELGWNVHVFCNTEYEGFFDNVGYYEFNKVKDGIKSICKDLGKPIDVFVSSRSINPFKENRPSKNLVKRTVLWMHDMPTDLFNDLPKALPNIDIIFFISKFQAQEYQKYFNNSIPKEKIVITRNGIDPERFVVKGDWNKRKGKCIYTTTPFRGLDVLMGIWPKIHEQEPRAELHVYSDMSIYGQQNHPDLQKIFDYGKGIADKYNIHFHKPVTQDELAQVMLEADLMVYPNHFPETSCITAMESITAKTPIITSKFGALPETIEDGKDGILIDGNAYDGEVYEKAFIDATVRMLKDQQYRLSFCQQDKDFSWSSITKEWADLFNNTSTSTSEYPTDERIFGKPITSKDGKDNYNTSEYWDNKYKNRREHGIANVGEKERYEYIAPFIEKNDVVADIGCGEGSFLYHLYMDRRGKEYYGFDISEDALKKADTLIPESHFIQLLSEPTDLRVLTDSKIFDKITCFHTLEHIETPELHIKEWKKSLKTGGEMIIIVPLEDEEYHEHLRIYTIDECDKLIDAVGAKSSDVRVRDQGWKYINGRKAKEAVIRLWFD